MKMKATFAGKSRALLLMSLTGLLLFVAPKARADEADPPSRVARISLLDGNVSLQPSGTEDWAAAAMNRPVTVGDKLWMDQNSRAELQTGQASLHLGSMTALSFLNLDENILQARIAEGAINFRVRELREGDLYEVDTPNLAFTVKEAGAFRVDVNENGDGTRVTVLRGEGEITAGDKTYEVHAGEQAELTGVDDPQYNVGPAPGPDDLDRWASDRDLKEESSPSAKYVSRDVPGYSDLDDNGSWREEPDYGSVWYPNSVAVGWAPYSYGYWNWVGPWGWTWVDYAPWGFAPFHYGRWAFVGGAWGWCPGPIFARPFYGPAFVGFVGGGFGFGFGGGFGGGIGWFPLGFREPFHPWYHASNAYFRNVNITNTRINNVNGLNSANRNFNYRYAHESNAVTAASRNTFVNGQAVNRGSMRVTQASLRGAQVTNRADFTPTRSSYTGAANARGRVSTPPASVANRSVVARTAPAAAASHIPVRTMNTQGLTVGGRGNASANASANRPSAFGGRNNAGSNNAGSNNAAMAQRQSELSNNRPPSANAGINGRASVNGNAGTSANRPANGSRNWAAQGNATDRGRAPQGFGNSGSADRPSNGASQTARVTNSDRPPWAGSASRNTPNVAGPRAASPNYNNNRPSSSYSNGNRSYQPPSRSYSAPSRSYSPPSRNYSAPSRTYSAPSRSYGGGGGGSRSSGGGGSRGGGSGGSHSSGGGGSRGGGGSSHGGSSHGH
jgi:FecR protein